MRILFRTTAIVLILLLGGMVGLYLIFGRTAPVPATFADSMPIDQAQLRAVELDKPMLVLATADWCIPCQFLKRGALTDERVAQAIRERTVPVYFDATDRDDDRVIAAAQEIGVNALPALIAIKDGVEIARLEGDHSALELLNWLERF